MQSAQIQEQVNTFSSGQIFQADEMRLRAVKESWSEAQFLAQQGIFYLKDVANKLQIPSSEIKKRAGAIEKKGQSPWNVMGVRKTWTHWIVRMTVFSEYFKTMEPSRIRKVDPLWDGNKTLAQKGRFFLSDVCEKIPFTATQIRYQARHNPRSQIEFGVWKEPKHKSYLVDMETFAKWIRKVWGSGLNMKTGQKLSSRRRAK